jgi:hypothetical protein
VWSAGGQQSSDVALAINDPATFFTPHLEELRTITTDAHTRQTLIVHSQICGSLFGCHQSVLVTLQIADKIGDMCLLGDEGVSGSQVSRPALDQLLKELKPGDTLITWKLDRLGRSLRHLIAIVAELDGRGICFSSLSEAIDTKTATGRLLFHVLGALAEFERALISERTRAGMAAAKLRGIRIGRPAKSLSA